MRLAIDLRLFLSPWASGVTVFTQRFIEALRTFGDCELDLFYFAGEPFQPIHDLFPEVRFRRISNRLFHLKSLRKPPLLPHDFFEIEPDLIWLPDRRPFFQTHYPLVMTVHDDIPEERHDTLSYKSRFFHHLFSLNRLSEQVDAWIAPSETSASFLRKASEKPVFVSYIPADSHSISPCRPASHVPENFVFFLAPLDPRKGIGHMLRMLDLDASLRVVWAGIKMHDSRFSRYRVPSHPRLSLLSQISEPEKVWCFQNARALLALSEREGFDLPVMEAIAHGCPVLLSDIPVHRELYSTSIYTQSPEDSLRLLAEHDLAAALNFDSDARHLVQKLLLFFGRIIRDKNR